MSDRQADALIRSTRHPCVAVQRVRGEYRLVAVGTVPKGRVLMTVEGLLVDRPSRTSVQLDERTHVDVPPGVPIEAVADAYPWRFLNHSCAPTAWLRGRKFVALRRILPSEEVTFDYNTTEYDMAAPFRCRCGSPSCSGVQVRGFRHLSAVEQRRLLPFLSDALRRRLAAGKVRARGASTG